MDTVFNETKRVEITPFVAKTIRTPSLTQVKNVSLNGLPHIQNIGAISYKVLVEFVLHSSNDELLLGAWLDGDLVKVVDDGSTYRGYIVELKLESDYADEYHKGEITIQEELML